MSASTGDVTMVTSDEALHFVQDVLGMPSPSTKLRSNPEEFLQDLVREWLQQIPFQTVKNIATPHHLRHVPTVTDIKQDLMAKIGGLCYQHNVFCFLILKALGFDVSLIACDIQNPSDHAAVIVHGLTGEGSKHYVDVGTGNPSWRVVPFDFKQESPVYHDSFLRYKFSRQDDIIYCLHHVESHPAKQTMEADRITDGWYRFITIHFKKGVEISHFIPSMTPIYTCEEVGEPHFFLSSVRCMAFPNDRFVCINGTTLLVEDEHGHVLKSYFRSRIEIKDSFARYFPQFSEAMLEDAMNDKFVKLDYDKGK